MQKRTWKRLALTVLSVFVLGLAVLAVHVYMVTRPRVDASTRILVRIDVKQDINQSEADRITAWLYQQKGVEHVLVNPQSDIAVFTLAPLKNSAAEVVSQFRKDMAYKAERFLPSEEEMRGGCPVKR